MSVRNVHLYVAAALEYHDPECEALRDYVDRGRDLRSGID
jgi:hypothetical protein